MLILLMSFLLIIVVKLSIGVNEFEIYKVILQAVKAGIDLGLEVRCSPMTLVHLW